MKEEMQVMRTDSTQMAVPSANSKKGGVLL